MTEQNRNVVQDRSGQAPQLNYEPYISRNTFQLLMKMI